jgi:hypothetical protein
MGALALAENRNVIVHAAYRDNMETILQLGKYLLERQMSAKKYLTVIYEDEQTAKEALFEHIQFCNKAIATILAIDKETNPHL